MSSIVGNLRDIQANLDSLARQHKVPGASLGILSGDTFVEAVTGVANKSTGVEVTPDTLFQIGSNTKVYNTTLLMQLVDEGLVDLDSPVRKYVPEFKLADEQAAAEITPRMCVTHTSGIQGDFFEDHGRGDDCLEKHIAAFAKLTQVHAPGKLWTYCNTGHSLAGRIVEKVTGKFWHEVLREKLLDPIGARRTTVLLEEMIANRYAVGHVAQQPGQEPSVPQRVMMSRAQAPAGSLTSSTPREVLTFVRMHLDLGRATDGSRVLGEASVRAMQEPQYTMPPGVTLGGKMGLGWLLQEWSGERVMGHGGGTIGQTSFMQVLPDRRFGVVLLTNSGNGGLLWRDLGGWLFEKLANVTIPAIPKPPARPPPLDLAKYTGKYERLNVGLEVTVEDGQLLVAMKQTGPLANPDAPPVKMRLQAIDKGRFYAQGPAGEAVVAFLELGADGRPEYLHFGGRASRRAGSSDEAASKPSRKPAAKARSARRG